MSLAAEWRLFSKPYNEKAYSMRKIKYELIKHIRAFKKSKQNITSIGLCKNLFPTENLKQLEDWFLSKKLRVKFSENERAVFLILTKMSRNN